MELTPFEVSVALNALLLWLLFALFMASRDKVS